MRKYTPLAHFKNKEHKSISYHSDQVMKCEAFGESERKSESWDIKAAQTGKKAVWQLTTLIEYFSRNWQLLSKLRKFQSFIEFYYRVRRNPEPVKDDCSPLLTTFILPCRPVTRNVLGVPSADAQAKCVSICYLAMRTSHPIDIILLNLIPGQRLKKSTNQTP